MAEFVKIGRFFVSTDDIKRIDEPALPDAGSPVLVHYRGGHVEELSKDDGDMLVAWANSKTFAHKVEKKPTK